MTGKLYRPLKIKLENIIFRKIYFSEKSDLSPQGNIVGSITNYCASFLLLHDKYSQMQRNKTIHYYPIIFTDQDLVTGNQHFLQCCNQGISCSMFSSGGLAEEESIYKVT
jgi:hypothetical protein